MTGCGTGILPVRPQAGSLGHRLWGRFLAPRCATRRASHERRLGVTGRAVELERTASARPGVARRASNRWTRHGDLVHIWTETGPGSSFRLTKVTTRFIY